MSSVALEQFVSATSASLHFRSKVHLASSKRARAEVGASVTSQAASPFVYDTVCSERSLGEAGMGHDCRLLQVILHRVQGHRHAFVGHLLWILRGWHGRQGVVLSFAGCPATGHGLRSCSCSLVNRGNSKRVHTLGHLALRVVSRQSKGRGKHSGENQEGHGGSRRPQPWPPMRPAPQQFIAKP